MARQIEKRCEGCQRLFVAARKDQRFHDARCKAQHWRNVQAAEEDAPDDPLAQALIRAFSLRVAGSVEAPAALRALQPLLIAEVEQSMPEPIAAVANDETGTSTASGVPWHKRATAWACRLLAKETT